MVDRGAADRADDCEAAGKTEERTDAMIDLMKLTPAPWRSERCYSNGCEIVPRILCSPDKNRECGWIATLVGAPYLGYESTLVNAEFIALARNAFDVLVRRGWSVGFNPRLPLKGWYVSLPEHFFPIGVNDPVAPLVDMRWDDPFTALVEADKWMTEQEKKHG